MNAAKNLAIFAIIVAVLLSGIMVYYKLSKETNVIEVSEELVWHQFSAKDMKILALDEEQGRLLSLNASLVRRVIGQEGELTIVCVDDKKLFYDFFEIEKTTMEKVGKETVIWLLWESHNPEDIIICPEPTLAPQPPPQPPSVLVPQTPPPLTPPRIEIPPMPSDPPGPGVEAPPEEATDEATEPSPEDNTPGGGQPATATR
jgi:hypothetical protein